MSEMTVPLSSWKPRYPQKDIMKAAKKHRFCVLVTHRQLGKTVFVVNWLIQQALNKYHELGTRGLYCAPFLNQAINASWDYFKHYCQDVPSAFKKINEADHTIRFANGAKLMVRGADKPDTLRGTFLDWVVLDEYGTMKPNVYHEIIEPMLNERRGKALFVGTPRGQNQFYEIYQHALKEYTANPNGDWWVGVYRADETNIIHDLEEKRKNIPGNIFRQEYLCDFTAAVSNAVFPQEILDRARNNDLPFGNGERVAALDVARYGDDYNVIKICEYAGPMKWREVVTEHWGKEATTYTTGRVLQLSQKYKFNRIIVDGTGVGGGVVDQLKEAAGKFQVYEFRGEEAATNSSFFNKRAETYFALREFMEDGYVRFDDPVAFAELGTIPYSINSKGQLQIASKEEIKKETGKSPDFADACMMLAVLFKKSNAVTYRQNSVRRNNLTADSGFIF